MADNQGKPAPRRCTARRTNGEPCHAYAVTGKNVCRVHGGMTPVGPASPHWKNGRYSKHLPASLLERYKESMADEDMLSLRDEIALVQAQIAVLLEAMASGDRSYLWPEVVDAVDDIKTAVARQNPDLMSSAIARLSSLSEKGEEDVRFRGELMALLEQRRRLVESEGKRLVAMKQMISAEQAMTLLAVIVETVREHVTDPDALRAISNAVRKLASFSGG